MRPSPLLLAAATLLVATACTRPRPTVEPLLPAEARSLAGIALESPAEGERLESPAGLSGRASLAPGQMLVGQVLSRDADLARWRGNALLAVAQDGSFDGVVSYTLDDAGPGYVEALVIDAASGTVIERQRVAVELNAAP